MLVWRLRTTSSYNSSKMPSILLLEPDALLANQYTQALKNQDHHVRTAVDAATALQLIDESVPAAVVLELQLGQHNGLELLYEIRSYEDLRALPVIILSLVEPDHIVSVSSYQSLHIAAYLYKPDTSLDKLCRVVADVLQNGEVRS